MNFLDRYAKQRIGIFEGLIACVFIIVNLRKSLSRKISFLIRVMLNVQIGCHLKKHKLREVSFEVVMLHTKTLIKSPWCRAFPLI